MGWNGKPGVLLGKPLTLNGDPFRPDESEISIFTDHAVSH